MAKTETDTTDPYDVAQQLLDHASTVQDLVSAGQGIAALEGLNEAQLDVLRQRYLQLRSELQNVVKIAELDGEEVTLTEPARYVRTAIGPSFMLTGKRQDGRDFEAWAPKPTHRWLESLPADAYPLRCIFKLGPHPTDPNKSMWRVTELGKPRSRSTGVPF